MQWLNSTLAKRVAQLLVAAAGVVLIAVPNHTVAWKVAAGVTAFGAAHGIGSDGVSP